MAKKNMSKIDSLFEITPYTTVSEFERENFHDQTGPAYSRYVIDLINRVRKIDSDLEQETRTFETRYLKEERAEIVKILESQDPAILKSAIDNWQLVEQDYWADHLGKLAAIELITYGKPTVQTMTKMVKLPEDLYIKATQICVRLANAIKDTTVRAEQEIGVRNEQPSMEPEQSTTFEGDAQPASKKLLLKKIK
jgi:hypothetical protein